MQARDLQYESSFDTTIIGGGPGGSQCALWLKMLGYKPCIIEKRSTLGGLQNESPYPNEWIVPVRNKKGEDVANEINENIKKHEIPCFLECSATKVESIENGYRVQFEDNNKSLHAVFAPYLVIASGVKPANGGLEATENLLIGPGKQIANYNFTGKSVAILGGGDSAFENYEFIQKKKPKYIHIYAQDDNKHSIKARSEFLERVPPEDIILHQGAIEINNKENTVDHKKYEVIVALYGWTAYLPFLFNFKLSLDEKGFVETKTKTAETSQPGVYAIGEVANRAHPCCTTAMADGVVAAKAIQNNFELAKKKDLLLFKTKQPIAKTLANTNQERILLNK